MEVADRQTDQLRADHAAELERIRGELERTRQDADRQDRLHREQRVEVEHLLKALVERVEADQARLIEERAQLQDELREARAEADHAKADQVRMAQDVAGMFDELRALADDTPSCTPTEHGWKPSWSARARTQIGSVATMPPGAVRDELDPPARMPAYGVKRPTASAPVSPTCRPTPNIPSGRWHGFRRNWNRRGGHGGDGWSGADGKDVMKRGGKYRVTHHLGRGPESNDTDVIFSHPDEEPARRFYRGIFHRGWDTSSPYGGRTAP